MCGIAGLHSLSGRPLEEIPAALLCMSELLAHRGPDGHGAWTSADGRTGLAHRRLGIIDLSPAARQPMRAASGATLVFNGAIYNYRELRAELASRWTFRSASDAESILAAWDRHGTDCPRHLRGMFAFALRDRDRLFCARDPFGIKPFYYTVVDDVLLFASECKALLPFLPEVATDRRALAEYLTFQYAISDRTLFRGIRRLPPGHGIVVDDGNVRISRYWDLDECGAEDTVDGDPAEALRELLDDSVRIHLRSDVPIGYQLSGGLDSSLIALLAQHHDGGPRPAFHGRPDGPPCYDESFYARVAAEASGCDLLETRITSRDFVDEIRSVIYHLDYPVAGPGSFPQYLVARTAAARTKVVLGGHGGDEVFGGYARYLVAGLERWLEAAIDGDAAGARPLGPAGGTLPDLRVLREYKPMIRRFWSEGLFGDLDARYLRLIDRSAALEGHVQWEALGDQGVREDFRELFNRGAGDAPGSAFERMTRFDFRYLLPALLHVEDRVSMAHGLESRVPFLDVPLVELVARVPAEARFAGGELKGLLKAAHSRLLPPELRGRRDKMGFPVPLTEWASGPLSGFVRDVLEGGRLASRPCMRKPDGSGEDTDHTGRGLWALLSLELWYQTFHDRAQDYRNLLREARERSRLETTGHAEPAPGDGGIRITGGRGACGS